MYLSFFKKIFSRHRSTVFGHVRGFTLIEVMVSVTIFTIIITIGIGALLTVNDTLKKTRAERQTIDSLSYVLDTMTRQLRTGRDYIGDNSRISFIRQDAQSDAGGTAERTEFYFDEGEGAIFRVQDGEPYRITPETIDITNFGVEISGTTLGDNQQPMVTLSLSAELNAGRQQSTIAVQTSVSQRLLDFEF